MVMFARRAARFDVNAAHRGIGELLVQILPHPGNRLWMFEANVLDPAYHFDVQSRVDAKTNANRIYFLTIRPLAYRRTLETRI